MSLLTGSSITGSAPERWNNQPAAGAIPLPTTEDDMDQVTIKTTKRGLTVYVPNSQVDAFRWIMSEGETGLYDHIYDGQADEDQENWNGLVWK